MLVSGLFERSIFVEKLTIVIPAGDGAGVGDILAAVRKKIKTNHVVLVVCDGYSKLNNVNKDFFRLFQNTICLKNKYGDGVRNAIRTGIEAADSEYVVVMMPDCADSSDVIDDMVRNADAVHADVVCASRYMKQVKSRNKPGMKGLLSKMVGHSLFAAGLPTHDPVNSFRLYRKSFLDNVQIESCDEVSTGMELVIKAWRNRYRVSEVPVNWFDCSVKQSFSDKLQRIFCCLQWYFSGLFHGESSRKICFYGFVILFLLLALREMSYITRYMINVPYWDEWGLVYDFPRHFDLNCFLKFHNEHRIVFTRLLSWCLYQYNHWNICEGIVLSFYVYLAAFFLFLFYFRNTFRRLPFLMVSLLSFFFTSFAWCNMLNSFQNTFHWMLLWGILAVIFGFPRKSSFLKDALFCVCCIFCICSMSPVFALPLILVKLGKSFYFREYRFFDLVRGCSAVCRLVLRRISSFGCVCEFIDAVETKVDLSFSGNECVCFFGIAVYSDNNITLLECICHNGNDCRPFHFCYLFDYCGICISGSDCCFE